MISTKAKILVSLMIISVVLLGSNCREISRAFDKSGNTFIVEIETAQPNAAEIIEQAVNITKNKINAAGLNGEVTKNPEKDNQIIVKIYGSNDWQKIKSFLFTTYQLELKKVISPPYPSPVTTYPTKEAAEQALKEDQEALPYSEIDLDRPVQFVIVEKNAVINGEDLRDAQAISMTANDADYQISFSLKPEAATRFGDWTGKNIGNYMGIVLNKEVQSVPFIKSQIFDQGQIDGRFTRQMAEDIAISLKSGFLPATMNVVEEKPFEN